MANEFSAHVANIDKKMQTLLDDLSICRATGCPVPNKHEYYPVPERTAAPNFLFGPVGCMPVVPTWLRKRRVMILGMYPTCRFATVDSEEEVPVRDIDEPFENSRYFDGYSVRNVRSGTVLEEDYLKPIGLIQDDLWITNMVKCFLFKPEHVTAYNKINWPIPDGFEATRGDDNGSSDTERYFEAAKPCIQLWLSKELELCEPKLVITLGKFVCRMIHADKDHFKPADDGVWKIVRGKLLRAGSEDSGDGYRRHPFFQDVNVFCMYHPAAVRRFPNIRTIHEEKHLPVVTEFVSGLQWD